MTVLASHFRCPACKGALQETEADEWRCTGCSRVYPLVLGIPLLLGEPQLVRSDWARGLGAFCREMDESVRHLLASAVEGGLPKLTRARLVRVADDLGRHQRSLVQVFREAGILADMGASAQRQATDILGYYSLIHRDFGWAPLVDEVTPSVEAILAILPAGFRLGRVLVLGAGTGRLAWELERALPCAERIVTVDINPLPFFVMAKLLRGEQVRLFELPGHPRTSAEASLERELSLPASSTSVVSLAFADGLDPPFADASFDTIVTPWFVDQVPKNAADLLPIFRRLLAPGGSWINHGPLVYDPLRTGPAHRYTADELLELVQAAAFAVSQSTLQRVSYMASPLSTQSRQETVLTFHASVAERPAVGSRAKGTELSFLQDPTGEELVPRPLLPSGYAFALPILEQVYERCDGQRSALAIAQLLVEEGALADNGTALSVVQGSLRVLFRAAHGAN